MDTWTHQLGYPLVTLRRHGNMIHASQKHFLLVNSSAHGANSSHKWHVPLSFTTSAAPNIETQIWMRDPLSLRASDSMAHTHTCLAINSNLIKRNEF